MQSTQLDKPGYRHIALPGKLGFWSAGVSQEDG
jgi:hypothetical protein